MFHHSGAKALSIYNHNNNYENGELKMPKWQRSEQKKSGRGSLRVNSLKALCRGL